MGNFIEQIKEDIEEIKEEYLNLDFRLSDENYAFNFWILQKLYSVDENIIPNYILEGSDRGIDCYYFNEDRKNLYLIQNKYYAETTPLSLPNVVDQFLSRTLEHLQQGIFNRSSELQEIFTKYKNDEEFNVFLHFYVTNNSTSYSTYKELFERYSYDNIDGFVQASFFDLEDIRTKYLSDRIKSKKDFEIEISTASKYTRVDFDPGRLGIQGVPCSQFMPINVVNFYNLVEKAKMEKYPLFEENIRDYIGEGSAINKGIINTLKDINERKYFIYYNNGITIIADKVETVLETYGYTESSGAQNRNTNITKLKNPQIVNGCQTVNSIFYVLDKYSSDYERKEAFKDVFVMVKVLQLSNKKDAQTYLKIVEYNNSQNAIKAKDFVASQSIFTTLKDDLKERGFFLVVKQSDKNDFKNLDRTTKNKMFATANEFCSKLDLELKISDLKIDLEKFMQTILAYYDTGYAAYTKKSEVLKKDSMTYNKIVEKIKTMTRQQLLSIYLYYLKSEKIRKSTIEKKDPISYYLLTILNRIQQGNIISYDNPEKFVEDFKKAKYATHIYYCFAQHNEPQYNKMIKQKMYEDIISNAIGASQFD